jgi:hypothetical protein
MRKKITILLAGTLALAGCQDSNVPYLNAPTLTSLTGNPTPASIAVAVQGFIVGMTGQVTGLATGLGQHGREFLSLNSQEPRPYNETLNGPGVNNASQGNGNWGGFYTNIRQGWIILHALDQLGTTMSEADKSAVKGFTKFWMAVNLADVIDTHMENGAVIDTDRDPFGTELGALVSYNDAVTYDLKQFDEAIADMSKAGATMPFKLNAGWNGFNTPANFLKVMHAVYGRHALHFKKYDVALRETNLSFVDSNASLDLGPTFVYSSAAGETSNSIFRDGVNYAHTSFVTQAEMRAGATDAICNIDRADQCDFRVARNVVKTTTKTFLQTTSNLYFAKYRTTGASFSLIRNEELILNRAEANMQLGNLAPAITDINLIRTKSGGLSARTDLTATNIVDELVKQRQYSLFLEADRWYTLRRFGKLLTLPKENTATQNIVWTKYPVPNAECLARGGATCFGPGGSDTDFLTIK